MNNFEQQVSLLTARMNDKGIPIDIPAAKRFTELADYFTKSLDAKVKDITGEVGVNQVAKLRQWFEDNGTYLPDLTSDTLTEFIARCPEDSILRKVAEYRYYSSKASTKKFDAMVRYADPDNKVRGCFQYYGANTGRWTARMIQPQNFIRPNEKYDVEDTYNVLMAGSLEAIERRFDNPLEAMSACLRYLIVAPDNHEFIISDYSNIEQRILGWVAGQDDLVQGYVDGIDLYIEMAKKIFPNKEIKKGSVERWLGKTLILGAGYGCGVQKFHDTALAAGHPISMELAQKCIKSFRQKYRKIVNYWYDIESLFIAAVRNRGKILKHGKLKVKCDRDFLRVKLPIGRCLNYPFPRVEENKFSFYQQVGQSVTWRHQTTWGGRLVENIVQAIARDIMASGMMAIEKAVWSPIMTVHDEVVAMAKTPITDDEVAIFDQYLTDINECYDGLPLEVETKVSKRYMK
jgi:DNA polymerase bacteriophage-type